MMSTAREVLVTAEALDDKGDLERMSCMMCTLPMDRRLEITRRFMIHKLGGFIYISSG